MSTLKAKPEAPKNDNHTKFPSSIWTYVRSPKLGSDSARLLWLNVEICLFPRCVTVPNLAAVSQTVCA